VRKNSRAGEGEKQAERRTTTRKQDALREYLANQAGFAGSERGADGNLFLARGPARQQQVGEIRADNQHYHADGAREQKQRRAKASAHIAREKAKLWRKTVALGVLASDLIGKNVEFRLSALHRNSWFEPANHRKGVAPAIGFFRQGKREVQVDAAAWSEDGAKVERGREDTHYGNRRVVEREWSADDRWIGSEAPLPEPLAQQDSLWPIPLAFIGVEKPAELRLHAEKRKEILRYRNTGEALRLAPSGQFAVADSIEGKIRSEIGERMIALAKIEKMIYLDGLAREVVRIVG
jgi:hypothetical protein